MFRVMCRSPNMTIRTCKCLQKSVTRHVNSFSDSQQRTTLTRSRKQIVLQSHQQKPDLKVEHPLCSSLNFQNIAGALGKAHKAWDKYDMNKSGTLSLSEVTELLNSPEIRHAVLLLTNVEPTLRTEEELQELFKKADSDKSGQLSRSEFMGLYMAIVGERVNSNPLMLAEALLGFLDVDRNGKIDGTELKWLQLGSLQKLQQQVFPALRS
jgi:hypothetical protein